MRWKKKAAAWSTRPVAGDTRVVSKFLLLPKKLGDEWRWLETTKIEEKAYKQHGKLLWTEIKFR